MKIYSKEEKFYDEINSKYSISRGGNKEDLRILLENVEFIPPGGNYVEIGVADGSSIVAVASFRSDINCYGIEIRNSSKAQGIVEELNIKNIHFYLGKGAEDVCKEWNKNIDLLFIDGEHYFKNIFWDFVGWYPYVVTGGKIIFHDFEGREGSKFEVGKALQVMIGHPKYNLYIPSIKDKISSSMAILTK